MKIVNSLAAAALALGIFGAAASAGNAADAKKPVFNITSPALKEFGLLNKKYAGNAKGNPNCDGAGVSLPLRWSNAPANTKSYAIIMFDPAGRGGLGVVHWLAYDIPATKTSLKEGEASSADASFPQGKNTPGTQMYFGPCPPFGDKPHPYVITLIATDLAPGSLKAGMSRDELEHALTGHTVGATSLVARYRG